MAKFTLFLEPDEDGPGGYAEVEISAKDLKLPLEDLSRRYLVPALAAVLVHSGRDSG